MMSEIPCSLAFAKSFWLAAKRVCVSSTNAFAKVLKKRFLICVDKGAIKRLACFALWPNLLISVMPYLFYLLEPGA